MAARTCDLLSVAAASGKVLTLALVDPFAPIFVLASCRSSMDHCSEIRIPILRRPHANTTDDLLRRRLGRRDRFLFAQCARAEGGSEHSERAIDHSAHLFDRSMRQ